MTTILEKTTNFLGNIKNPYYLTKSSILIGETIKTFSIIQKPVPVFIGVVFASFLPKKAETILEKLSGRIQKSWNESPNNMKLVTLFVSYALFILDENTLGLSANFLSLKGGMDITVRLRNQLDQNQNITEKNLITLVGSTAQALSVGYCPNSAMLGTILSCLFPEGMQEGYRDLSLQIKKEWNGYSVDEKLTSIIMTAFLETIDLLTVNLGTSALSFYTGTKVPLNANANEKKKSDI